jgi:hypothetical protein
MMHGDIPVTFFPSLTLPEAALTVGKPTGIFSHARDH